MQISLPRLPMRSIWVFGVVVLTIFSLPFIWYVSHITFQAFQTSGSALISDLGTDTDMSDSIELFFTYADKYILVLALIVTALWAWIYSQRKGVPVYDY